MSGRLTGPFSANTRCHISRTASDTNLQVTFPHSDAGERPRASLSVHGVFESPSGVVITTRQVMEQGWPILLVTHDADEPRGWEFVNGHGDTEDAASGITVHVEHVIERHPSVAELADLPEGWQARRSAESDDWIREPIPLDG